MGAPYMWLNMALEDALASYLAGQIAPEMGVSIYRMADITAFCVGVAEPFVGVTCANGRPLSDEAYLEASTSTRVIEARLTVRSHAVDDVDPAQITRTVTAARTKHALLVGMVMDALHRTDIVEQLNNQQVTNLAVNQVDNVSDATQPEDRSYTTTLSFEVVCHVSAGE